MAKAKAFPRVLYVVREEEGDDEYFVAADTEEYHAKIGERVVVAVYELKHTGTITATVKVETGK